jgi:peptidoglycan/LPS O-acetylase OafA/YrhL
VAPLSLGALRAHLARARRRLLLVVLALPASASNNGWPHTIPTILANLSLVHGWIPWRKVYFSYNSPSWSVSTEAFFYLAFPLLIRRVERTWMVKVGIALLLVIGLAALCNRVGLPLLDEDQRPAAIAIMYINPLARLFEFVLGMGAAVVWQRLAGRFGPGRTAATLVELGALVLVVVVVARSGAWAERLARFRVVGLAGDLWLLFGGISSFAFATLIVVMALERGFVSRVLSHRLPVRLGEVSYAVYLLHQPLVRVYALSGAPRVGIPNWLAYTLFWAVLLAGSHALWSLVERPSRTWLVRHGPAARPVPVTPAAESLAQSRR